MKIMSSVVVKFAIHYVWEKSTAHTSHVCGHHRKRYVVCAFVYTNTPTPRIWPFDAIQLHVLVCACMHATSYLQGDIVPIQVIFKSGKRHVHSEKTKALKFRKKFSSLHSIVLTTVIKCRALVVFRAQLPLMSSTRVLDLGTVGTRVDARVIFFLKF